MRAWRWLVTALSLAAVGGVIAWELDTTRTGPGPLHPAHAAVPGLQQGANCEACHESGAGVAAARCNTCHQPIGGQIEGRRGLHGRLPAATAPRCGSCHPEHHGEAAPLLGPAAFARAGIADPARYRHDDIAGFALTGAHTQLACTRCHVHAEADPAPHGGRWQGLAQTCTGCHDDAHRQAYGSDCAGCHGQEQPFAKAPRFVHERFPLRQAHANHRCDACHPAAGPHAVANLQTAPAPARACRDCHADPHAAGAPAANARMPIRHADDCTRCHATTTFAAHGVDARNHVQFGVPLDGPHAQAACAQCHGDRTRPARWQDRAPAMADCAACHASPHRAALMPPDRPPRLACGECHADGDMSFAIATTTAAQHARIGFELVRPHANVGCPQCHAPAGAFADRHPGRDAGRCDACHADAHAGQFAGRPRHAQCVDCHERSHFVPVAFDVEAHADTPFPLRAAHAAVACDRCHERQADGVRRFVPTPTRCSACHRDPHGGRFDGAGTPAAVAGRTDCARCHDERAFAPVAATFDHGRWTDWALTGSHAAVSCQVCHPQLARPDATGRRTGAAAERRCADCHEDVHQGQFAVAGRTGCARCHDTARFGEVRFDHQRDSAFPLDAAHRKAACAACHRPTATPRGPVVRYKPLGHACADCHGQPRSPRK